MKKPIAFAIAYSMLLLLLVGCVENVPSSAKASSAENLPASSAQTGNEEKTIESPLKVGTILRRPEAAQFADWQDERGLDQLLTPNDLGTVDLRSANLVKADLSGKAELLLNADFDSITKWPASMPNDVNPFKIMELGKDPGLGVRSLHQQGITGKGVGIAIIDQPLLVDHQEYGDRLRLYQEYHIPSDQGASMHGAAVSSIALGKTVGVAPDALLYYIADITGDYTEKEYTQNMTYYAQDIHRIIALNQTLSKEDKIRIISISAGYMQDVQGAAEMDAAVAAARAAGIAVILVSDGDPLMQFNGIGRKVYGDLNDPASWQPGGFWEPYLYSGEYTGANNLLVPMDRRTTASFTGTSDYVYYAFGGASWTIPYVAGLYALACQVKPEVTFDEFFQIATMTAEPFSVTQGEKTYACGKVVDPVAIMEKLKG